jgi:hypothetical protein
MTTRSKTVLAAAMLAGLAVLPPSQADAETAPRLSHVQLSTGIRMHFAEQGSAHGKPVILLHGFSDSWFSFSRVLPQLPRSLSRVRA